MVLSEAWYIFLDEQHTLWTRVARMIKNFTGGIMLHLEALDRVNSRHGRLREVSPT